MTPRRSLAALLSGAALCACAPLPPPVSPAPPADDGRAGAGGGERARGAGIARADGRRGRRTARAPASPAPTADAVEPAPAAVSGPVAPASPAPTADAVQPAPAAVSGPVARFIGFVGPRVQHDPPFLGVPYTNFYCLRSFLDRQTGETAHQLYVADSYFGEKRGWEAAHDAAGNALPFTAIGSNEIACDNGCAYAEEFAATIPAAALQASTNGLAVTFTARSGKTMTIALSGEEIANQLAVVDAARRRAGPAADQATLASTPEAARTSTTFSADLPKK